MKEWVSTLWNIQHDKLDLENYLKQWIYCCKFSARNQKKITICEPLTKNLKIVWYQHVYLFTCTHSGRKIHSNWTSWIVHVLGLESRIMNASQLVNWIYNHYLVSIKSFSTEFSVNENNENIFNPFFDEKKILFAPPVVWQPLLLL